MPTPVTPAAGNGAAAANNAMGAQQGMNEMPRNADGTINYGQWATDSIEKQQQQFAAMQRVSEAMTEIGYQKSTLEALQSAQKGRQDKFAEQIKDMYR